MRNRIALRLFFVQLIVIGGGASCFLLILPASVLLPDIADQIWWTCLGTLIGMLALALVVSVVVASYVSHVVEQVQHVTRSMMAGDLDERISVAWSGVSGELGMAVNTMTEVLTERVRLERREHAQMRAIMAGMQEALVVVDLEGKLILSNSSAQSLMGMSSSPEGLPIATACRSVELIQLIETTLSLGRSRRVELRLPPIAPRVVSAQATPWKVDDKIQGVVVVGYDLTPQREMEEMHREFVANVSHELKTPLTAIRGYVETLQSGAMEDPNTAQNFVNIIARNAEQMQYMVEDLLRLSKLEAGRMQVVMEELFLPDIIADLLARFQPRIQEKSLQCRVSWAEMGVIRSDRRMMIHVISNLVDNAIKYSREGDELRISGRREDGHWVVEVTDTGVGIASEELPRVFERFWRTDRSRTRATGGSGLGLAIVKQLVTQLRGTVQVQSEEGKGTTFTVRLPVGL
jgi:two-component system phosphate regulon sensor histidine kinase PhoR